MESCTSKSMNALIFVQILFLQGALFILHTEGYKFIYRDRIVARKNRISSYLARAVPRTATKYTSASLSATVEADVDAGLKRIRPLGGYERLLSRLTPCTDTLSLSHAASYLLNRTVSHDLLTAAAALSVARCVRRLRVIIVATPSG